MAGADENESPSAAAADSGLQVEGVTLYEIGSRLVDLGEKLRTVGQNADSNDLRKTIEHLETIANYEDNPDDYREIDRVITTRLRRTLTGLASFRKEYATQERITVEYCLKNGMTQRDVARFLGVGLSTVNRWAQHPLTYDQD